MNKPIITETQIELSFTDRIRVLFGYIIHVETTFQLPYAVPSAKGKSTFKLINPSRSVFKQNIETGEMSIIIEDYRKYGSLTDIFSDISTDYESLNIEAKHESAHLRVSGSTLAIEIFIEDLKTKFIPYKIAEK